MSPSWGKLKPKQTQQEQPRQVGEQQSQPQVTEQTAPVELTPEELEVIDLYRVWKEKLFLFELPDLYIMLGDIIGAIVGTETEDYQLQVDALVKALNETRAKVNLPPLTDDDLDDDIEEESDESGDE